MDGNNLKIYQIPMEKDSLTPSKEELRIEHSACHPNYPPEIGGAAHLISELAASLKAKGHDVIVVTAYRATTLK